MATTVYSVLIRSALILATFGGTPYFDLDFHLESDIGGQNEIDFLNQRVGIELITSFWHKTVRKKSINTGFFFLSTEYTDVSTKSSFSQESLELQSRFW